MLQLISLAARNLFRNTRRTIITGMAVALGLSMMIFTVNLQNGSYQTMIKTAISTMAGHVVIQADTYQDDPDELKVVTDSTAVARQLGEAFPNDTVARRIFLAGLLTSPTSSVGVGLSGLEPTAELKIADLHTKIVDGTFLEPDDSRGILIGRGMADTLGVEVGDKLVYMGQHGGDEVTSRLFRVRGIFRTGGAELDGFVAVTHIEAAQALLELGDVAHQVTLHIHDARESVHAADKARAMLGNDDLEVLPWMDALPELYALIQVDRNSADFMMIIIGFIVAAGVLNTVLMSVLERTKEFGVLMSIGMKPRRIATMVLIEGLAIGIFAGTCGVLLGLAISYPAVQYGIDYSGMLGADTMEMSGIAVSALIKAQWDPVRMTIYTVGCAIFTMLSAVYPAWWVTRLRPVEALRHH